MEKRVVKFFLVSLLVISLFLSSSVFAESPRVISTHPANGATDVSLETDVIEITFDKSIDILGWEENIGMKTNLDYETNRIIFFGQRDNYYIIVLDGTLLSENTEYTIDIGDFKGEDGGVIENYTFSFKTTPNKPAAIKTSQIILFSIILLAIIITIILIVLLKKKSGSNVFERFSLEMKKAVASNDVNKARDIYEKAKKAYDLLPESSKRDYYNHLMELYNNALKLSMDYQ